MEIDLNMKEKIVNWLLEYLNATECEGYVIGVSGGVDSGLTSTLCAMTGKKTVVVNMPIHQNSVEYSRSEKHIDWLCENFSNVESLTIELTSVYDSFKNMNLANELSLANTRSRLRMVTLYMIANTRKLLVVGTGNKVEDYGIGFFTKYGDGGVDISPIADLLKSEVRQIAEEIGMLEEIVHAIATDGLWEDGRTDEQQIGATYTELEWALVYYDANKLETSGLSDRQKEVLKIYFDRHHRNKHKLELPPVCSLGE
jgi:NAD+ synthase